MTVYRARVDGFVVGLSVCVVAALGSVMTVAMMAALRRPASPIASLGLVGAALAIAAILIFAWVYTPRAFRLDGGNLRIERPAGDVTIPLVTITEVVPLDVFLGLSWKAPPGGNSGLFGIYGTFYRRDIGKFQLYGRAASRAVLLETSGGKVVVTPEHREAFMADIVKETQR